MQSCIQKTNGRIRVLCSIKLLLTLGFVLQAVIPICIIVLVTEVKQRHQVYEHTQALAALIKNRVRDSVGAHLDIVLREDTQNWFNNQYQTFDPYNISQAQEMLYPSIKYTGIISVYYTRIDRGLYAGYGRYCDCGNQSIYFQYAIDGKYYNQPVDDVETGRTNVDFTRPMTNISLQNEDWHVNALRNNHILTFSEPFYIGDAKWTADPTVWISTSSPVTNPSNKSQIIGIANADYTISSLSSFLEAVHLSPNSAIYLVDSNNGNMIASSDRSDQLYNVRDGKLELLPLSKSKNAVMGYIGSQLELKYNGNYTDIKPQLFKIDNNLSIYVDPIQMNKSNLRRTILTMIAVSDYMGPTKALEKAMLIVDIVLLVVAVMLGIIFSILITHPLSRLTNRMRNLSIFGTNVKQPRKPETGGFLRRKSLLYEVSTLQSNFAKMENAVNGFMKYVPREIVLNFINHPTQQKFFQPGVEPADIAILFTDVEEFTSISEKLQPDILIKILTDYLEAISCAISEHGGTLDKYIGDAVMALFGCPEKLDDYVTKACCCALAIRDSTSKLNKVNESIGLPAFKTRIGIHAGRCLVGNIGSSYRLSYTAMGDAVNLASRIESLNKHYGTYLMISQECYDFAKSIILCRLLDKVTVMGRTQGVTVYEMVCQRDQAVEQEIEFVDDYNFIMSLYFEMQFAAAFCEVSRFVRKYPLDKAAKALRERLQTFIQQPPTNWNGCTVMHEK